VRHALPVLTLGVVLGLTQAAGADDLPPSPRWEQMRETLIGPARLTAAPATLSLEAPDRAQDPAQVPITLSQPGPDPAALAKVMLVIDENPAPLIATIIPAPAAQPLHLSFPVRVDAYSAVRALGETAEGVVMAAHYVKASGGCSAPPAETEDSMGDMALTDFGLAPDGRREVSVQIRHPNHSGLQRDQVTLLTVPPHYIDTLRVMQNGQPLLTVEAGISVAANPTFRFRFIPDGSGSLTVRADDTDGLVFEQTFALGF